jgi:predicted dehydrogenase
VSVPVGAPLRVGIVGCGLIGAKRAEALGSDRLVACCDVRGEAAAALAERHGAIAAPDLEGVLAHEPDVVVVATNHAALAELACQSLDAGAHVLVEKPAGIGTRDVERIAAAAERADRRVKVGFNHRFHPGIRRALEEARSGSYGDVLFLRGRYGHGGRLGYEHEWRFRRELSGGGELTDQGMHLLDLSHAVLGPLPLHAALVRSQFWPGEVEDNAALLLGEPGFTAAPWAQLHVSWTEWKNMFSLEIYCRTAKLAVDGLVRSYGPQSLTIHRMRPELGPPDTESIEYAPDDVSWRDEWSHFAAAVQAGDRRPLDGDLESAHYAWSCVEAAYREAGTPVAHG